MYDVNLLRKKCDELLENAKINNNQEMIERLQMDRDFLTKDNCFVGADYLLVLFLFDDLGYSTKDAIEVYDYYNKKEMFPGYLEYVSSDGELVQIETLVNPELEEYYKFVDDTIFKLEKKSQDFYSLIDGDWVYDGDIQRKFYDAGYDYSTVKCVLKSDSLRRR